MNEIFVDMSGRENIGRLAELDADPKHMSRTKDELDICDSAYLIFPGKNLTKSFDVGDKLWKERADRISGRDNWSNTCGRDVQGQW